MWREILDREKETHMGEKKEVESQWSSEERWKTERNDGHLDFIHRIPLEGTRRLLDSPQTLHLLIISLANTVSSAGGVQ